MAYFGVIGNRDFIKLRGDGVDLLRTYVDWDPTAHTFTERDGSVVQRLPYYLFLDQQPGGWLSSLAYGREDLPHDRPEIWDCGAWSYKEADIPRLGKHEVTPAWALEQYQNYARPGALVIAPDHMLIPGLGDLDARRDFNRNSAREFLQIATAAGFFPMATVHGETVAERLAMAEYFVGLGYDHLSLGGLAGQATRQAMCIDVVTTVRRAFPDVYLHVLGLSSPTYASHWYEIGVDSFDGSSHFKHAFSGGTYYTQQGVTLTRHQAGSQKKGIPITAPLCDCRACSVLRADGVDTREYGSNENNMGRAVHNQIMLMRALECAKQTPLEQQSSLFPV